MGAFTCPFCGSDALQPDGKPALLDGEQGWVCAGCQKAVGPARNRALLVCYLAGCIVITGLVAAIVVKTIVGPLLAGRPPEIDVTGRNGILLCVGTFVGLWATAGVVRAFLQPRPVRRRREDLPAAEREQQRAD
jgi:hypothetical protein